MLRAKMASLTSMKPSWPLQRLHTPRLLSTSAEPVGSAGGSSKKSSFRRKAVRIVLISLTGGFALSALDDLVIFYGCSNKAIEMACQNQKIIEAMGFPIVRGPWCDASLTIGYKRTAVACTFPVSGPQGSGTFRLKAIPHEGKTWYSFLRRNHWTILVMDALLHVRSDDKNYETFYISLTDYVPLTTLLDCKDCRREETEGPKKLRGQKSEIIMETKNLNGD